jgi:hypothetical protein
MQFKACSFFVLTIALMFYNSFGEESFIVKPKNKSEPKVTLEDCMGTILDEQQLLARIEAYSGAIKVRELEWAEQIFNERKNGVLKKASKQQLQKLADEQQQFTQACQKFEQASRQYRDFLAQFEQELVSTKTRS